MSDPTRPFRRMPPRVLRVERLKSLDYPGLYAIKMITEDGPVSFLLERGVSAMLHDLTRPDYEEEISTH